MLYRSWSRTRRTRSSSPMTRSVVPEGLHGRLDLAQPGLVDTQGLEEGEELLGLSVPDHVLRQDRGDAHMEAVHVPEDVDGPERRLEGPRKAPVRVVDRRRPVVQADRDREQAGVLQVAGQLRGQRAPRGEELDGAAVRSLPGDADDVLVQERLAARPAQPADAQALQIADDGQDLRGVQGTACPVAVVAIDAPLRAGVGQADLGVGGSGAPLDELFADEPRVRGAVERGEMGMEDEVLADLSDPELPHILQEKKPDRGADLEQMGISPEDPENGPADRDA